MTLFCGQRYKSATERKGEKQGNLSGTDALEGAMMRILRCRYRFHVYVTSGQHVERGCLLKALRDGVVKEPRLSKQSTAGTDQLTRRNQIAALAALHVMVAMLE